MSIQLYTQDNLTIVAGKGECLDSVPTPIWKIEQKEKRYTIRLHISILINWKIKTIFQQYEITKELWTAVGDKDIYKLKEYNSLNALSDILSDLGYRVTWIFWIINKWIEKLFNK